MRGCLILVIILFVFAALFGDNMDVALGITFLILLLVFIVWAIVHSSTHELDGTKKVYVEPEPNPDEEDNKDAATSQKEQDAKADNGSEKDSTEVIIVRLSSIQFNGIAQSVKRGIEFCRTLSKDDELRNRFFRQAVNSATYQVYSPTDFLTTLTFFMANDLFDCFYHLGHKLEIMGKTKKHARIDYATPTGQALFATLASLADKTGDYKSFREEILSLNQGADNPYDAQIRENIEKTFSVYLNSGASISANGVDDFNLVLLLRSFGKEELIPEIRQVYYDYAEAIALSDNDKDGTETAWLEELKEKIELKSVPQQPDRSESNESAEPSTENDKPKADVKSAENPMKQLDELIGLKVVKSELQTLTQFIKVNQKRQEAGLRVASISYHCVFAGNPGTGKTTVARILAGIYKQLGILKKGQLIETDRSGLVAEYVGQTAVKTNKIIDKALGGVLFIDEAYTLAQGGEQDYGREAIATLLKRMEDDRDRLVVILAGYTNEIEQFINSNPGLRSRFNRYVHFEDYTEDELFKIFLLQARKYDYRLDEGAEAELHLLLKQKVANKQKDFGNARYVRNLFEKVIENQAVRLSKNKDIDKSILSTITKEDIHE